ncbi:MAG: hypothetical protein EAZ24_00710 [Burkholderiales bacterium]|nr:MAG: hypothetical protein EAZ24_00710 [Burkholderiales bacterium]
MATTAYAQTEAQLPSCFRSLLNPPALGEAPVILFVDAFGNFFSPQFEGPLPVAPRIAYIPDFALSEFCARGFTITAVSVDGLIGVVPKEYLTVMEFREDKSQIHYLAARGADADYIVAGNVGRTWRVTGLSFKLPRRAADLVPVHMFFGRFGSELPGHLYTADTVEYDRRTREIAAGGASYTYERIAFYAPAATRGLNGEFTCSAAHLRPAYRLYKRGSFGTEAARYRVVGDPVHVQLLERAGWINEGASFCVIRD